MTDEYTQPVVSVILPVYNAEQYLDVAIRSVLWQTYTNFELIILNDGSTDRSDEIIRQYNDKRIRYSRQDNRGLIATLNTLIGQARGQYIARMDADDVSLPERLATQVHRFEQDPPLGLLGSWVQVIDHDDDFVGTVRYPVTDTVIRATLAVRNSFAHGSVMFRRSLQPTYSTEALHAEDYDLWCRLAGSTKMANIPEVLYQWRFHPQSTSSTSSIQNNTAESIRRRYATTLLGHPPTTRDDVQHERRIRGRWPLWRLYRSLLRSYPDAPMTPWLLKALL